MKLVFSTILSFLFSVKLLTAQVIEGVVPANEENYHNYFFKSNNYLRENVKFDKGKVYTPGDSLELFISDSVKFHSDHFYYHQQSPHACQNRFYKIGYVNPDKKTIIPFEYDWIQPRYDSFLLARKGHTNGIINNRGKTIISFGNTFYYIHDTSLVAYKNTGVDSVLLFYNTKGRFLFRSNGYRASRMSDKYVSVWGKNEKYKGLVDLNGKWVKGSDEYDNVQWVNNDFICAYKNHKFGIVNSNNQVILPFEYDNISPAGNHQFIIFRNGMSGVMDSRKQIVIPLDSISIGNFGSLYTIRRRRSDLAGLINSKGKRILEEKYHINIPDNFEKYEVKKTHPKGLLIINEPVSNLSGLYSADGSMVLPIEYSYINYRSSVSAIIIGKKTDTPDRLLFAAIDGNGKILVPFSKNALQFIDRNPALLLARSPEELVAFVNAKTGEFLTAYEFEGIEPLFPLPDGYLVVKKNWRYALVSPGGKILTEIVYAGFYPANEQNRAWFSEEIVCLARLGEKLIGITKTGKAVQQKDNK